MAIDIEQEYEHPSFIRAKALPEPLRTHFAKNIEEAHVWKPIIRRRALASRVLVVARTRIECAWAAYIDAVPGMRHEEEVDQVLNYGAKLDESIARSLFHEFAGVPYAK